MKQFLIGIDKVFTFIEKNVIVILLNALMLIMFVNVVGRWFGHALTWGDEICRYINIWCTFVAVSAAVCKGTHVCITVIPDLIPNKTLRAIFDYISVLGATIFFAFIAYTGVLLVLQQHGMNQTGASVQIPLWITYLAVPTGSTLAFIRYLMRLYEMITGNKVLDSETDDVEANTDVRAVLEEVKEENA